MSENNQTNAEVKQNNQTPQQNNQTSQQNNQQDQKLTDENKPKTLPEKVQEYIPPNATIYIRNLNEKIKQEDLRKQLYELFSQFGPILDIITQKRRKMRGQAFIVFKDINTATTALRKMNGFTFHNKPMVIQYAKSKSYATAQLDGTFQELKRKRDAEKAKAEEERPQKKLKETKEAKKEKKKKKGKKAPGPAPIVPNNILFVENLPEKVTMETLEMLFQNFSGFKEVRLVPGKAGIAFVEYETEMQATRAMNGLQGFKTSPTHMMKITYAKK